MGSHLHIHNNYTIFSPGRSVSGLLLFTCILHREPWRAITALFSRRGDTAAALKSCVLEAAILQIKAHLSEPLIIHSQACVLSIKSRPLVCTSMAPVCIYICFYLREFRGEHSLKLEVHTKKKKIAFALSPSGLENCLYLPRFVDIWLFTIYSGAWSVNYMKINVQNSTMYLSWNNVLVISPSYQHVLSSTEHADNSFHRDCFFGAKWL